MSTPLLSERCIFIVVTTYLILLTYRSFFTVIDLKIFLYYRHSSVNKQKGMANEYWKNCFFTIDGSFTDVRVP